MAVCSKDGCLEPHLARGLCHRHYRQFLRQGAERRIMARRYGLTDEERFLAYVRQSERCWEWIGYKNAKGYGVMNIRGKRVLAHRFAYERIAEVPDGMCVLHHCDNPACVRFKHLFLGTKADNNADMEEKGRAKRIGSPRGIKNHAAKLTEDAVRIIRQSTESGPVLATRYSITRTTVSAIRRRLIWNHLE